MIKFSFPFQTWVTQPPQAPLKTVYSCWSPRNLVDEARFGVPSGAGWHLIGDPAETIFNNLRSGEMLVGMAGEFRPTETKRTKRLQKNELREIANSFVNLLF